MGELGETPAVFGSAIEEGSLSELTHALKSRMRNRLPQVRLQLSVKDGETLAAIYREGEVLGRVDNGIQIEVTVRLPEALLGQLRGRDGVRVLEKR